MVRQPDPYHEAALSFFRKLNNGMRGNRKHAMWQAATEQGVSVQDLSAYLNNRRKERAEKKKEEADSVPNPSHTPAPRYSWERRSSERRDWFD